MIDMDLTGDLDGRDLIWLMTLGNVLRGEVGLGLLVSRLERLVLHDLDGSPRHISRCLHEMERGGHLVLRNDGKRWRVALGPNGRDTFHRLMAARSTGFTPSLDAIAHRVRAQFATLAA